MGEIAKLQQIIDESKNIVFFGGAGVSTESGIPDFRSVDGLYHQEWDFPPEVILSHTFSGESRQNFIGSIRQKCCATQQSQMQLIKSWHNWRDREN